jgi:hypothetical protein
VGAAGPMEPAGRVPMAPAGVQWAFQEPMAFHTKSLISFGFSRVEAEIIDCP